MRILLRLIVLGIFAAAGVGAAVYVALNTKDSSEQPANVPWVAPPAPSTDAIADKLDSTQDELPIAAEPVAVETPTANATLQAPVVSPAQWQVVEDESAGDGAKADPLARITEKLDQFEDTARQQKQIFDEMRANQQLVEKQLSLVHQAATQNQLARLEESLQRIEKSTTAASSPEVDASDNPSSRRQGARAVAEYAQVSTKSADDEAGDKPPGEIRGVDGKSADAAMPFRITANLKGEDIRDVLDYLSEKTGLNILASANVRGTVTASLSDVDLQSAVSAILHSTGYVYRREGDFVYVGTPQDLDRLDQLRGTVETRIYRTNYVTAAELQKLISPLLTADTGFVTLSTPSQRDIPADNVKTGGDDFAGNEVLIVRDYENVLRRIDDLVARVDQRPRQVAIEATIMSVSLNDSFKAGVNFEALRTTKNLRLISGTPLANLANIDISKGGLNVGFLDNNLAGFIQALESMGDVRVVASPRVLCLNKQRAEILIGDQKGFLSTTQTETATTQTVEFLDVGTQLRIRPFISSDGMIRLEVHPELSSGDVRLVGDFALPEKTTTQVTTNIMCPDGCTVVLGGLIREEVGESYDQIPLLGDIPLAGKIFRRRTETVARSEIIVLITPRIVYDPGQCEGDVPCGDDFAWRQAPLHKPMCSPIARRHYAQRYYRLAESSWAAGNTAAAVNFLNLSLQFSPRYREALNLYELIASSGYVAPAVLETIDAPDELPDVEANELGIDLPRQLHRLPSAARRLGEDWTDSEVLPASHKRLTTILGEPPIER